MRSCSISNFNFSKVVCKSSGPLFKIDAAMTGLLTPHALPNNF